MELGLLLVVPCGACERHGPHVRVGVRVRVRVRVSEAPESAMGPTVKGATIEL